MTDCVLFHNDLTACPGGAETPCEKHGKCDEGSLGNGTCTCDKGFTGDACELCEEGRFGPECKGETFVIVVFHVTFHRCTHTHTHENEKKKKTAGEAISACCFCVFCEGME